MNDRYVAILWLHVLAAVVWLGGMLFFAVAAPILRDVDNHALRARLFDALGRRYRIVGWVCVGVLVLTGLEQLRLRGWWGADFWGRPATLLVTPVGVRLTWKLGLVAAMIGVQALHDFWLGPRAGRVPAGTPEARSLRSRAAWLARMNALLGLALLYAAVRLGR